MMSDKNEQTVLTDGSPFAEGENSLIIFVTGIGQSFSYLFGDEYLAPDAFETGTLQDYANYAPLIEEGKFKSYWNIFPDDLKDRLRQKDVKKALRPVIRETAKSFLLRKNALCSGSARKLVKALFAGCTIDENGNGDPRLVTPRHPVPLSGYPETVLPDGGRSSRAKQRFYACVPCAEVARRFLGDGYEDLIYCFNYKPYSLFSQNVKGLHDFIEKALSENKTGAREVVLIPMSMGATVVSAYLAEYPRREDNHVRRVVSIVGCWRGSDAVYDLVKQRFVKEPAELIAESLNGKKGVGAALARAAFKTFSRSALRELLFTALDAVIRELIFDAPSLMALIPADRYDELRSMAVCEKVLKEADAYQAARLSLKDRLYALYEEGITFSFIAGYGLEFGEVTRDYNFLDLMRSAKTTNSDEIINIESTVPGAEAVKFGGRFEDQTGRRLSPDGSVDISSALFPDCCWLFKKQKHELEYNNTALSLALLLALGRIKTVDDCSSPDSENGYYPQFNDARDTRMLVRRDLPALEAYIASGGELSAEQQKLYEDICIMLKRTVNDHENDSVLMERFAKMTAELDTAKS